MNTSQLHLIRQKNYIGVPNFEEIVERFTLVLGTCQTCKSRKSRKQKEQLLFKQPMFYEKYMKAICTTEEKKNCCKTWQLAHVVVLESNKPARTRIH